MTATIFQLVPPTTSSSLADDTATKLRKMADDVEAGKVTEIAVAWVEEGSYMMGQFSCMEDTLLLATLYQRWVLDQYMEVL